MNNNKTEIILLTTNESGVLASVMMASGKLGLLLFKNHSDKVNEESSRLTATFNGALKCSEEEFISTLEALPKILLVESTSFGGVSNATSAPEATAPVDEVKSVPVINKPLAQLQAIDIISAESVNVAEEKLLDLLGPVASMLVSSAKAETKHIGDMFVLLSEELDGHEKEEFLSLVNGIH